MRGSRSPREETQPARVLPADGRARAVVEDVSPAVDGGRFPVKRVTGEELVVEADAFADGHDVLRVEALFRHEDEETWRRAPMRHLGNDRWRGAFVVDRLGRWRYRVRAWVDPFASWLASLRKRVAAGQDPASDLLVGAQALREVAVQAGAARRDLERSAAALSDGTRAVAERVEVALAPELSELVEAHAPPHEPAASEPELVAVVGPPLARCSAWYELFPRSASPDPTRHGTLRDVEALLPYVAEMGFDVLYLPPIHPIGTTFRKGPNNSGVPRPGDPGSPWAIGSEAGGHDAVHPELGTAADLRRLAEAARARGIELALDVAFQTSPDHPWVREHPEWFRRRPDGSIQYAENPPKKYQDIYPFDFECEAWPDLWEALLGIFEHWIGEGVRVFRVDNPHTKSLRFWEWCIGVLGERHPEVILLSEAFTRPRVMQRLAKVGFTQSYTYFPWRNRKEELTEYLTELTSPPVCEYLRGSHWTNTPDILTEHLQLGGRPAFLSRAVLASMLGASWGVYGPAFELCEGRALRDGSEEYLDSEKYQQRHWDLDAPHSLRHVLARLNRIRRENPALQQDRTLLFHQVDNPHLLCWSKTSDDPPNAVLVVVNLDPHHVQSGWVWLDLHPLGLENDVTFQVHDLLSDARYLWRDEGNYVELDPQAMPAQIFRIRRRARTEQDFDYFA